MFLLRIRLIISHSKFADRLAIALVLYRRVFLRIIAIIFRNVCWFFKPIRTWIGSIFWRLWFRWAPVQFHTRQFRPHVSQNPWAFFTADGCVDDLAKLWYNFDFGNDLQLFRRLVSKYGTAMVLRTVDSCGKTVSHWIAETGTKEALKFVAKADPSIVDAWRNDRAMPLVHLALMNYNIEVLDTLVNEFGLDIMFLDNHGLNAMMRASIGTAVFRPKDVILRGFVYGIDVNSQSPTGHSALHYAVQSHSLQSVRLLLWLGANPALKDNLGRTPYDFAIQYGHKKFAQLLAQTDDAKSFTVKQSVLMYFRLLRYSWGARCAEFRFWLGAAIITIQLALAFGYLIPTYFTDYFDMSSHLHISLCVFILLTLLAGYRTVFKDSGFIPLGTSEYFELMRYLRDTNPIPVNRCKTLDYLSDELVASLCHVCQCIAPFKSKHCYHCGRCCLDYDHHCVFLFTCIGRANVFSFIAFTGLLAVCGLHGTLVVTGKAIEELRVHPYYARLFERGLYKWSVLYSVYTSLHFYHFLNVMLCTKYIIIGTALCIVTIFKWRYFCRMRQKYDIGDGTSTKVMFY